MSQFHLTSYTSIIHCRLLQPHMSLMKRTFVFLTHTIHQTEIPALLVGWVTNTPSVKMLCTQNIAYADTVVKT